MKDGKAATVQPGAKSPGLPEGSARRWHRISRARSAFFRAIKAHVRLRGLDAPAFGPHWVHDCVHQLPGEPERPQVTTEHSPIRRRSREPELFWEAAGCAELLWERPAPDSSCSGRMSPSVDRTQLPKQLNSQPAALYGFPESLVFSSQLIAGWKSDHSSAGRKGKAAPRGG